MMKETLFRGLESFLFHGGCRGRKVNEKKRQVERDERREKKEGESRFNSRLPMKAVNGEEQMDK